MWIQRITIDDFTFDLQGTNGEDGVVIPLGSDLDNPKFIAAVKQALRLYPLYDMSIRLEERSKYTPEKQIPYLPDEEIDWVIQAAEILFNQTEVPVDDSVKSFVATVKEVADRRAIRERIKQAKSEKRAQNSLGFVYLLQSQSGHYKIGRTTNPQNRLKTFSVKLPFEVEYICLIQVQDMYQMESELHTRFAEKRINGEWFNLSPEDVNYIKGLAS